jgi:hypothetical protein
MHWPNWRPNSWRTWKWSASFVSYWRSTARDLRHIIRKATGRDPEGEWVRGLLSRMVPQTKAVVHQFRKGRHGCL